MKSQQKIWLEELDGARLEPSTGRWLRARRAPALAPGVAFAVVGLAAAGLLALALLGAR